MKSLPSITTDCDDFIAEYREVFGDITVRRTGQQNNSLHKALRELAIEMDLAKLDMRRVIKVPIKPTMENVKENMFKPVMNALYPEVESTADLTTTQMIECWEVFSQFVEKRLGIYIEWPSEEE